MYSRRPAALTRPEAGIRYGRRPAALARTHAGIRYGRRLAALMGVRKSDLLCDGARSGMENFVFWV